MLKAVLLDVDFTLFRPGPELGPEGYAHIAERHGLTLEPALYDDARRAAIAGLQRHPELVHDEELWVAFTEQIVVGMGGDGPGARECALDVVRQLDGRPAGVGGGYGSILTDAANVSLEEQVGAIKRPDDLTVKAVIANRDTGEWHEAADGEVPNAVWVHTTGSSPIRFLPGTAPRTGIKRSALGYGNGAKKMPFTTLKIAVVAPMPSASITIAVAA